MITADSVIFKLTRRMLHKRIHALHRWFQSINDGTNEERS